MPRLSLVSRLILNCCGCGTEPASIGVGLDASNPDETFGRRCWDDPQRWTGTRPPHTHLDAGEHTAECAP